MNGLRSVATFLVLTILPCAAIANGRHALVVGISEYETLKDLPNAVVDARHVDSKLKSAGYETTLLLDRDATQDGFIKKWAQFIRSIQIGDEVVVYYAGHGVEIDFKNYIVPQESKDPAVLGPSVVGLTQRLIPMRDLVYELQKLQVSVQLWILDACRVNPFSPDGRGFMQSGGLGHGADVPGSVILYSASYGQQALDRLKSDPPGANLGSPFSREFVDLFDEWASQPIERFAGKLRSEVVKSVSNEGYPQFPMIEWQLSQETWCVADCKAEAPSQVPESVIRAAEVLANSFVSYRIQNNSFYLGKQSALDDCDEARPATAHPFGCETLRDLVSNSADQPEGIIFTDFSVTAGMEVNVRRRLPKQVGSKLVYECRVGVIEPGSSRPVSTVVAYNDGADLYFFGLVDSVPLEDCNEPPFKSNSIILDER